MTEQAIRDINGFLKDIAIGAIPSKVPLSALVQAHPHIKDVPKIVVTDSRNIGSILSAYESDGHIAVYVPNGKNSSIVSPAQLLLVNLVGYAGRRLHETTSPEGLSLDKLASNVFEALMELDPAQLPHLNRVRERDSMIAPEYTRRVMESYRDINNLPRYFRDFVDAFIKKAEKVEDKPRIVNVGGVEKLTHDKVILAGIPSFLADQEHLVRDYGLYHPKLIYVVSR